MIVQIPLYERGYIVVERRHVRFPHLRLDALGERINCRATHSSEIAQHACGWIRVNGEHL